MAAATKERIFQIANELEAGGQHPTLAAVRKALEGESFTTISEAMGEWRARKAAKERLASEPAPQVAIDRFIEFGGDIWALAVETANGRFTSEREALEAARIQLEVEKNEAVELVDQVTAELEAANGRVTALESVETGVRHEAEELRAQIALLVGKAGRTEARAIEIKKWAQELNKELVRVNQQNADLVKALVESAKGKGNPVRAQF